MCCYVQLAGASYMEVHAAGGGINYTVDCVRKASQEDLYQEFKRYALRMLQAGYAYTFASPQTPIIEHK